MLKKLKQEYPYIILSLIIGFAYTFYLCGTMLMNTSQINLPDGDINAGFQLWIFFKNSPWIWPLWYTPNIIYPLGTYIQPPLPYVILKLISPILPKVFVFQGYLAFINSSLQFYVGFCIFRALRNDKILAILGGIFVLSASFFAWRFLRHFDLTCQWLILLAIFLTVKPSEQNYKLDFYYYLALLFFSIGFAHPYIPFMIYAIGIGQIFKLIYEKFGRVKPFTVIWMLLILTGVFLAGFYFFSYFNMENTQSDGFGYYKSSLLGFIYPPFDTFFMDASPTGGNIDYYEGECYLGLGIILFLATALTLYPKLILRHIAKKKYIAFILAVFTMFIFSLSNRITLIAGHNLFEIPVPDINFIITICSTLRSSGRFTWPLGYLLIISSVVFFYDYMYKNKKLAYVFLSFILAIQIIDLSKMYYSIHNAYFNNANIVSWNNDLHDKFWNEVEGKYKHLIIIDENRDKFSYLAALNGMTINIFNLSRYDQRMSNLQQQLIKNFLQNKLEDNSLYIISQQVYNARDMYLNLTECKTVDNYIVCSKN